MLSRILIKLIDQAILPAIMLLVARVGSVFLFAKYFGYNLVIDNTGFVFDSAEAYYVVNTYSIFSMVAVLSIGLLYILTKSLVFHETHITPGMSAKLFSYRLSYFIQNSFDIYSQATVWMSYIYLMLFVSGAMFAWGLLDGWVFFSSLFLTVISTVLFVYDIEHEINLHNAEVSHTFADDLFDEIDDFSEGVGSMGKTLQQVAQEIRNHNHG